ncbi:uncharacterized protein LOC120217272 [Hibiscus syriacus]|uniref:uncharacterized protein LOC120217272 n=1 Tax=Hibiscus syriacus TaxID=106335 RepID=UPI001923FF4B|nr:uncharacterized protein LOC120217272 [Hibiscus syriacus]
MVEARHPIHDEETLSSHPHRSPPDPNHLPSYRSTTPPSVPETGPLCCSISNATADFLAFSPTTGKEQARKALESALGGKKAEYEKWDKEIKRREQAGGGDNAGGGGWFGWGGRFGWSNGDNFWQEAQQATLAILGIILMYLIIVKGEVMLAVIFNPLLYALRGTRDVLPM